MESSQKTFDPSILNKISNLKIKAKAVTQGVLSGIHKSRYKGSSIEFLEHKKYSQGDDIRQIDWKLLARTDKHYIKQFEDETNITACFLIDTSGSMGYKSTGVSKLEYATTFAASLSYLLINQSDAVGMFTFSDKIVDYIAPKSGFAHFNNLLDALAKLNPKGKTNLTKSLISFSDRVKKRCTIFVISDFFDDKQKIIKSLKQFSYRENNVVLFQVLDPYELEFPFEKAAHFVAMEDERSLSVDPKSIRDAYISKINAFIKELRTECLSNNIKHVLINSSVATERAIINYITGAN